MSISPYPQKLETLKRPAAVASPLIPDNITEQLTELAEHLEVIRSGEEVVVGLVRVDHGLVRFDLWAEISDCENSAGTAEFINPPQQWSNDLYHPRTLQVTNRDILFLAVVEAGEVRRYVTKPFSPSAPLVPIEPDFDAWMMDEGSVEFRLHQQELALELEGEDEGALSNITQIEDNKFQATRPDRKIVTITIPVDDSPLGIGGGN